MRKTWLISPAIMMIAFTGLFSISLFSARTHFAASTVNAAISKNESAASTFDVNSTGDQSDALLADDICDVDLITPGQQCTLRAALEQSNATAGADGITFNIGAGNPSITPGAALPTITGVVTIDGGTGGATRVQLIGTSAGAASHGLVLGAGSNGSTVRSLVIRNFGDNGIRILSGNNFIENNYVGTTETGNAAAANGGNGVIISAASGNTIGGSSAAARNIISGNSGDGVEINGDASDMNIVAGNLIGTDSTGTADLGNSGNGVLVTNSADNNRIGGFTSTPGTAPGNLISGNNGDGIEINGIATTANEVLGNLIGLQATGLTARRNEGNGVLITAAPSNFVGSSNSMGRNVISGHAQAADDDGVDITGESADTNIVAGNYIGTNINGTAAIANGGDGILVQGGADSNTIGGSTTAPGTAPGNVIAGNTDDGVEIAGSSASGNKVQGNIIGLQASGAAALANGSRGVYLTFAVNTTIGGATSDFRNVISGNGGSGIRMDEGSLGNPDNNTVQSNYIGTDITGMIDLGNASDGVILSQADDCTIGGATSTPGTAPGNLISGNNLHGIEIENDANSNTVLGNLIGTKINGTEALANSSDGVRIEGGSDNNAIGGAAAGSRNIISGNGSDGVEIFGNTTANTNLNLIQGNYIGTAINGNAALANAQMGVRIGGLGVLSNTVGGTTAGAGNLISGNISDGVNLNDTNTNTVQGNLIGTSAAGTTGIANGGAGVHVSGNAGGHTIGGTIAGAANTIAFNTGDGVWVEAATGNSVRHNSIHSNGEMGIDLGASGVTSNDAMDTDTGANNLQNFPMITSASVAGGNTIVAGTLNSMPNTTFDIDFYSNTTADSSGQGEGQTFRGSTTVTTDGSGNASFSGIALATTDQFIVSTATNTTGASLNNTSEFGQNFNSQSPSAIELAAFNALTDANGAVFLEWRTGYEADNLGFNIYREAAGKRTRINARTIAGSALLANTTFTAGRSYVWADDLSNIKQVVQYWLEDIDLNGKITLHGPAIPSTVDHLPPKARAVTLSNLKSGSSQAEQRAVWPSATHPGRRITAGHQSGDSLQSQWDIAARAAVKLSARETGWYNVTQPELVAAGLDVSRDPRFLQLFADGQELPIIVNGGAAGRLEPTDSIEFYATGLDTAYTDARVYYLVSGDEPGRRIDKLPFVDSKPGQAISFLSTIEIKPRSIYFAALKNGDADNFFGPIINGEPVGEEMTVKNLDGESADEARLEIALQGVTAISSAAPDHTVRVKVNGNEIGAISFDGQSHETAELTFSSLLLREGSNSIQFVAEGGAMDISLLDYARLTYPRKFCADQDALQFTATGEQAITITGFSHQAVRVVDVTDPNNAEELTPAVAAQGSSYDVTIAPHGAGSRRLLAFTAQRMTSPAALAFNRPSTLNRATNGANFVIISHHNFASAMEPLKLLRQRQGMSVFVIDVEDIYDEFSFGARTPEALRDFLARTAAVWKKRPTWVMLAGDASFDPRNYLGLGESDFVPTRLVETVYLETASDDWLVDFNADGLPDMAVGRLPVRTNDEAETMIAKITRYAQTSRSEGVMMVADRNEGYNFEAATAALRDQLPVGTSVQEIFRGSLDDQTARQRIIEGARRGPKIVNYVGHGSVGEWRGGLLTSADAASLSYSEGPSLFVMMTCLNGFFHDMYSDSLAESLMKCEAGGAVAVWASSALTSPEGQSIINRQLYQQIFAGNATLGEAAMRAKIGVSDEDVRRTWILFGDPTTRLK